MFCLNFSKHFDSNLYFQLVQKFKKNLPKIDLDKINKFPKIKKINKKITVGFISGDFGNHPVSYYLLNTISHIKTEKFELECIKISVLTSFKGSKSYYEVPKLIDILFKRSTNYYKKGLVRPIEIRNNINIH